MSTTPAPCKQSTNPLYAPQLHPPATIAAARMSRRAAFSTGVALGFAALAVVGTVADGVAFWSTTALRPTIAQRVPARLPLPVLAQIELAAPPPVLALAAPDVAEAPQALAAPRSHHHHAGHRARSAPSSDVASSKIERSTGSILNLVALRAMRVELDAQYTQARRAYNAAVEDELESSALNDLRRDLRDLSRRTITLDALITQLSARGQRRADRRAAGSPHRS